MFLRLSATNGIMVLVSTSRSSFSSNHEALFDGQCDACSAAMTEWRDLWEEGKQAFEDNEFSAYLCQ